MNTGNTANPITRYTLTVDYHVPNAFDNEDIVFRLLFRQLLANFEDRGFNRSAVIDQEIKRFVEKSMESEAHASEHTTKREGE